MCDSCRVSHWRQRIRSAADSFRNEPNQDQRQQATTVLDVPFCGPVTLTSSELLLLGEYYKKSKYFKNALSTVGFRKYLLCLRLYPNLCQRTSLSLPAHLSMAANTPLRTCASAP